LIHTLAHAIMPSLDRKGLHSSQGPEGPAGTFSEQDSCAKDCTSAFSALVARSMMFLMLLHAQDQCVQNM